MEYISLLKLFTQDMNLNWFKNSSFKHQFHFLCMNKLQSLGQKGVA